MAIAISLARPPNTCAWENTNTHPRITDNAVSLLPDYRELASYESYMDAGTTKEDEIPSGFTVFSHFYDPTTGKGLHTESGVDNALIESLAVAKTYYPVMTAPSRAELLDWNYAESLYAIGFKGSAYEYLGHALHLMSQDMGQPGHVHNDPHIPPGQVPTLDQYGLSWLTRGLNGSNESPLEASAESACSGPTSAACPNGTPAEIPTSFPSVAAAPQLNIAEGLARAAYLATIFPGDQSFTNPNAQSAGYAGQLHVGTNDIDVFAQAGPPLGYDYAAAQDCLMVPHFEMDASGIVANNGTGLLCYNPVYDYAGTVFVHFSNNWWNISTSDGMVWDPRSSAPQSGPNQFYIHDYDRVYYDNAHTTTLNQYLQGKMLPLSAEYSAALMIAFAQAVDSVPPGIALQDGQGNPIPVNGYTQPSVNVSVTDEGNIAASGVAFVAVESIDSSGNTAPTGQGNLVSNVGIGESFSNSFSYQTSGLSDGQYQIHAVDGLGNQRYSTFTVTTKLPGLSVQSATSGSLPNYATTTDNNITITATPAVAPFQSIQVFQDGAPYDPPFPVSAASYFYQFDPNSHWYWVQACDVALNCALSSFGIFPPGSTPPPPPPPPQCPGCNQPPPPPPPSQFPPSSGPPSPGCVAAGPGNCFPGPGGGPLTHFPNPAHRMPGDPNSLTGPEGSVSPGQTMAYTVEFENVGSGTALGIYVKDVLDPALDETTLSLSSMYTLGFSSSGVPISTTSASFPWTYDPQTRTVTLLAGDAGPQNGGTFQLQAQLRSSTPPGTIISNQGLIYFPNALQQLTPTNTIVSAVPRPTTITSVGASSTVYLSNAGLAAELLASTSPVPQQPVTFQLLSTATSALTSSAGVAAADVFVSSAAGTYNLGLNFGGDGFLYLPTAANVNFAVTRRPSILQAPFSTARPTDTVHMTLTMTDDRGQPLQHQVDSPKTVTLELLPSTGPATALATGQVSGSTVSFTFAVPQPLQVSWPIRARFDGDNFYAATASTGILRLIDDVAPAIAIQSPRGGQTFSGSSQINVAFTVNDNADLSPSATGYLVSLNGAQSVAFSSAGAIPAASLAPGSWTFIVDALDWEGNPSTAATPTFLVTSDVLPPRSSLSAGFPSFGTTPIFVSSQTALILAADDDSHVVDDGQGTGVAQSYYAIDGGSWTLYGAPFTLAGLPEGTHKVSFYSVDAAGNTESPNTVSFYLDETPPATSFAVSGIVVTSTTAVLQTTDAISFVSSDAASGVGETLYSLDASTTQVVYLSSFTLAAGTHTLSYQSIDNVGVVEQAHLFRLTVRPPDLLPPRTNLLIGSPSLTSGTTVYVAATTTFTLAAVDDRFVVGDSSGVGVASTYLAIDTTVFSVSLGTFTMPGAGPHNLQYYSIDAAGNSEVIHSAAVFVDSQTPTSSIAIGTPMFAAADGAIYIGTMTPVTFSASASLLSSGTTSGVASLDVSIDSAPFRVGLSSVTLPEGAHFLSYYAVDLLGNVEPVHSLVVHVDSTPPVSVLVIGQPTVVLSSTTLLVSSRTIFAISAVDPLGSGVFSGVRQSFYSVNGSTYGVYGASFTLTGPDGQETIAFYSQDNVLNTELAKSSSVLLDATPPSLTLFSPSGTQSGMARVLKGRVPVLGSVFDLHLQSYVLDFAPGQNASSGFVTIGSGTVSISSGVLAIWDATKLAGWQTLRLTATDLVLNQSMTTINVFVGDPSQLLILGNDDVFNMPQGVAIGPTGSIYVADTNAGRIAVFSSTGTPIASIGRPAQDGDDLTASTTSVVLNHPEGVFIDTAGHIFVADTNDNRVLELSTTGQILLSLGRQRKARIHGDHDAGDQGATVGEFNKPAGVAVDAIGNIYVADTLNNRVQVFNSTGASLVAFSLPAAQPLPKDTHDRDADRVKDKALGRPYGIAVDAAGRIYVADPRGSRALEFSATGQLLLAIPIAGGQPSGVAVTPDGTSIFVSDRKLGQVFGFDALGQQVLAFGQKGDPGSTQAVTLRKPFGLALDAANDLFIADRNGDRIKEVSLPTSQPTLVVPPAVHHDGFATGVLDQDSGGVVARSDNAGINIPPGALTNDLKIVVSTAAPSQDDNAKQRDMNNKGMEPAYAPVQYYPEGTQFAKPVTLTLPYDPALVAQLGINEDSLHVNYWDPVKQQWQTFNSTVDKNSHTVSAQTTHFSLYQVMSGSATTQGLGVQATASNTVDTVQIACNPLRPDCRPIKFQSLPAGARLRIYTITGALVRDIDADGSGQATWDGTNQSGASVASGVYFVLAQGNGTKKTFKVAVEK